MSNNYEIETMKEIWRNKDGFCFEVGPDRDGLGIAEIRLKEPDGKISSRITLEPEAAVLVAKAILELWDKTGD